jgi:LysM repeat protein
MKPWRGLMCILALCIALALPASTTAQPMTVVAPEQPPQGTYAAGDAGGVRYTVKRGDTLISIGARFGVSAAAIARANGIADPDYVQAGTVLIIPVAGSGSQAAASAAAKPSVGARAAPASSGGGYRFVASISKQSCWLYYGSAVKASWTCSTGRAGSPTIPGNYRIRTKLNKAWGSTWGFWMPYWLGIYMVGTVENGIHGLPYYPLTGKQIWGPAIGTPVSFGCVVMSNAAMAQLFNVAYVGMPVTILR